MLAMQMGQSRRHVGTNAAATEILATLVDHDIDTTRTRQCSHLQPYPAATDHRQAATDAQSLS